MNHCESTFVSWNEEEEVMLADIVFSPDCLKDTCQQTVSKLPTDILACQISDVSGMREQEINWSNCEEENPREQREDASQPFNKTKNKAKWWKSRCLGSLVETLFSHLISVSCMNVGGWTVHFAVSHTSGWYINFYEVCCPHLVWSGIITKPTFNSTHPL